MPVYQFQHTRISNCQRVASLSATRIIISASSAFVNTIFRFSQENFETGLRAEFSPPLPVSPCRALRPKPHLQPQSVGNHRDKFAVGGFALDARDRVAEVILQGLDVETGKMSVFCNKNIAVINCKIKSLWGWCAMVYWVKCIPF